jgi:uncharacterized membrane protein YbhN (UPF0104 family)
MTKSGILDFNLFVSSFQNHKMLILGVILLQVINCFFMAFRYQYLLRIFKIQVGFFNGLSATVVSNSIGLWLPGSMAFIEVIRIGLMLGASQHMTSVREELSLRAKLTAISLFDRLIGLFVMLVFGGGAACYALFSNKQRFSLNLDQNGALIGIAVFSFLSAFFIAILPIFAKSVFFRKLLGHFERICLFLFRGGFLNKAFRKLFYEIFALLDAVVIGSKQISHFFIPIVFSCCCFLLMSLGTYFCAIAISNSIPFLAIFATLSILSLASLLPIGIAGIGGIQLVAAMAMTVFGVDPKTAASAQFLQTAINLLSVSALGFFFLKLTINQVRAILKTGK